MKIAELQIHNFRSIQDATMVLGNYTLLVGANNSGKSNIIDVIRLFYEKDLKFNFNRDFPKFITSDQESWLEIEYELSKDEIPTIKNEYLINSSRFRVRKWLYTQEKTKAKEGFFGYENGALTGSLFYGWKNVAQAKLGNVIFIPAVSHLEEHTKLTGPSVLRDLINDILKPIIAASPSFAELKTVFENFSKKIKVEQTSDNRSLSGLEEKINTELLDWQAQFNLEVSSPQEDLIIKNLIKHTIKDGELDKVMESDAFGHGFQMFLIFTLIRISSTYTAPKPEPKKKEFSPELDLILFEEPEAFLHPPQQDVLDTSLRQLTLQPSKQVIAATHSPLFVSCNTDDISDLVVLHKVDAKTVVGQVRKQELDEVFKSNQKIYDIIKTSGCPEDDELKIDLESVRHFLWLNPERCGLFFANRVLIVEGLCEQVLIHNLIKEGFIKTDRRGVFVLEVLGKYNIHRFMNLFSKLKIEHSVLYDDDQTKVGSEKAKHDALNQLILDSKNDYTHSIDSIPGSFESFLGVEIPKDDHGRRWKASYILCAYKRKEIRDDRLTLLKEKILRLLNDRVDSQLQEFINIMR